MGQGEMVTLSLGDRQWRAEVIALPLQSLQHISIKPDHDAGDDRGWGRGNGGFMHFGNWDGGSSPGVKGEQLRGVCSAR